MCVFLLHILLLTLMSSFSYISPLSNSSYLAVAVLGPLAVSSLSVPVSEHAPRRQCLYIDCERAPHSAAFSWSAISPHSQKSTLSYRNSRDLLAELFIRQALSHVMPSVYYFPFVIKGFCESSEDTYKILSETSVGSITNMLQAILLSFIDAGIPIKSPVSSTYVSIFNSYSNGQQQHTKFDATHTERVFSDGSLLVAGTESEITALRFDVSLGIGRPEVDSEHAMSIISIQSLHKTVLDAQKYLNPLHETNRNIINSLEISRSPIDDVVSPTNEGSAYGDTLLFNTRHASSTVRSQRLCTKFTGIGDASRLLKNSSPRAALLSFNQEQVGKLIGSGSCIESQIEQEFAVNLHLYEEEGGPLFIKDDKDPWGRRTHEMMFTPRQKNSSPYLGTKKHVDETVYAYI